MWEVSIESVQSMHIVWLFTNGYLAKYYVLMTYFWIRKFVWNDLLGTVL